MVYIESLSLKKQNKKKKKRPINHRVISENPNPIKKIIPLTQSQFLQKKIKK